jgi:hypothetical protein
MEMERRSVGIRAGGPADPDATRAAAIVAAYFDAEGASGFRRIVCRAAALGGLAAAMVQFGTSVLTRVDLVFGAALASVAVVAAALGEWRSRRRLEALMQRDRSESLSRCCTR